MHKNILGLRRNSLKIDNKEKTKIIRKKWLKPELTKIRLNPEQAVLSCCQAGERGWNSSVFDNQCLITCTAGTVYWESANGSS
ncbi:MAG: hypothetical protein PHP69_06190 [Candidatus Omnitrophica bacterium]|nr:hypothetical protein [Candidatus Omnitrophota bacterium]MDD5081071.1 hypothetical protein [Candidatus Omnitrophota bacterium]